MDTTNKSIKTRTESQGRQNTDHVKDPVDVERRIDYKGSLIDLTPEITIIITFDALSRQRKRPVWWILEIFIEIPFVIAFLVLLVDVFCERLAAGPQEVDQTVVLRDRKTHLKAKTCSYLRTKSTAGISSWTTSHPRTARKNEGQMHLETALRLSLTIADPNPLQGQIKWRLLVNVIGNVYGTSVRDSMARVGL